MRNEISPSMIGYAFLGVALLLLHLYWIMLGVGVVLVVIDELAELYAQDALPSNPFARKSKDTDR